MIIVVGLVVVSKDLWNVCLEKCCVSFERICRCCLVVCFGMSSIKSRLIGWLLGELKGIGVVSCMNVLVVCFSFLIWLWGMVIFWLRLVDFSFLWVNKLLKMIDWVSLRCVLKSRLVCLNICFLLLVLRLSSICEVDRILVKGFIGGKEKIKVVVMRLWLIGVYLVVWSVGLLLWWWFCIFCLYFRIWWFSLLNMLLMVV